MIDFSREIEVAQFKCEYENRIRIFNDSQRICQTTTNIDVFKRRVKEVEGFIEWSFEMKEKGMPLKVDASKDEAFSQLGNFVNFHCKRIAEAKSRRNDIWELNTMLRPSPNFIEAAHYFNKRLGYEL